MSVFGLQCFSFYILVLSICVLFRINVKDLFSPRQSIKTSAQQAKSGKKGRIRRYCSESVQILRLLGAKNPENLLAAVSFGLITVGVVVGNAFNNILLCFIFGILGLVLPFFVIRFVWSLWEQKMSESLEVALSRITSSYMRPGMNFEDALKENMNALSDYVRPIFETILLQTTYVDADIDKALRDSKLAIHNPIYKEWVNAVIRCQSNQTLKPTLPRIVNKFTDQRIIIGEAKVLMQDYRRNFFIMFAATALSPAILYFIRREWFSLLITSTIGQILLSVLVICLIITLFIGLPALNPDYNLGHNADDFEV